MPPTRRPSRRTTSPSSCCPGSSCAARQPYTNEYDLHVKALIEHYARRMRIEQRLAEIIQAFCAYALSSTVNLNVDLDVMLCVLAQALTAALRSRFPGYAAVTPDTLQRRFLETSGKIITSDRTITVRLDRRAYARALGQATCPTTRSSPGGATAPCATKSADLVPNLLRGNPR